MHPKGEYLAAADDSGMVKVYSTRTRRVHKTLRNAHTVRITAVVETVEYHANISKLLLVYGPYVMALIVMISAHIMAAAVYGGLFLV